MHALTGCWCPYLLQVLLYSELDQCQGTLHDARIVHHSSLSAWHSAPHHMSTNLYQLYHAHAGWSLWTGMGRCCAPLGWTSARALLTMCGSTGIPTTSSVLSLILHACRVEIVDWDGQVLRSFGLNECEGAPHDARIVRRSSLVGALRSAIPAHLIRYGVSVANVHAHEQGALAF